MERPDPRSSDHAGVGGDSSRSASATASAFCSRSRGPSRPRASAPVRPSTPLRSRTQARAPSTRPDALAGLGPTCVLSYMVDAHVRAGRLERILGAFEPAAVPVQVVIPAGRFVTQLVRAFMDRAVEPLRATVGASTA